MSRKSVDWERVEQQFRAGLLSLREIAEANGCSHVAVTKRAKANGWERDLSAKIKAKAEALVNRAAVNSAVNAVTEKAVIDANAATVAGVGLRHRSDLKEARDAALAVLAEVRAQGEHAETLDQIAEMLGTDGDVDKMRAAMERATSLPSRAGVVKAAIDSLIKVVEAERAVWKLDKPVEESAIAKSLSDAERASRVATILERARIAKASAPPSLPAPGSDARH